MPFAVYCCSLDGAVGYWDTGEAQTVPWIFGIMHATGFPAFTMLAGIFAHVVAFGAVSWRVALFSALALSGAAWLVSRIVVELEGDAWIAMAAGWLFAFGQVAWTRGTRAEVHDLATFFGVATIAAFLRWYRTGDTRALVLGALAWGLGIATHPIVALLLPALVLLLAVRAPQLRARSALLACAALFAGLLCYGYLPARSAAVTAARLDPTLSLGLPPGGAFWDNNHPSSWSGFVAEVSGTEFGAGGTVAAMLDPQTYVSGLPPYWLRLLFELTPAGALVALGGVYALGRRDRFACAALLLAFAVPTAFALAYTIEADPQRYYLIGYAVAAAFAGVGAGELARALPPMRGGTVTAAIALAIALLVVNRQTFEQRHSSGAQAVIDAVVKNTPDHAVLLSPWIDATPLAYAAYVEHRLGHRIVVSSWLSENAKRVPRWTQTRPVFVVGQLFGSVPHYTAVPIPGSSPVIYRIVRSPQPSPSR